MSAPTVSFNGSDLASSVSGLRVIQTDPFRIPDRDIDSGVIANDDKSFISAAYFQKKKINVIVQIVRNDRDSFEASMDQLVNILQAVNATLAFSYNSGTRQWTATMSSIKVSDQQGGSGEIDIEFQCTDPLGYDNASTTLVSSSRTGRSSTDNFIVGGTFAWQAPVITITLTNVTGGSSKTIQIGNPATGQTVQITRTWATNDVIEIDVRNKTVKVNGTEVDFSGGIPEWAPGSGAMDYTDDMTTATHQHSVIYYKRYL